MILKFLQDRKERKAKKIIEDAKQLDEWLENQKKKVDKENQKMTDMTCALNGMHNCTEKCVHFKKGEVKEWWFGDEKSYLTNFPKCKLWHS